MLTLAAKELPVTDAAPTMLDDSRAAEILDIVAAETGVPRDKLTPDASLEALGIPSLDLVQTVFALETRYDIEIPVAADRSGAGEFDTVGDLVAHVLATLDRAHPLDRPKPVDRPKPAA